MSIRIDDGLCTGCAACADICPGDLIYIDETEIARIRDGRDCWDCASCIKGCPTQAIEMYLPVEIGGRGSALKAKTYRDRTIWFLTGNNGHNEIYDIEAMRVI